MGIALDNTGNVIVCGYDGLGNGNSQYTLIKHNNAGVVDWVRNYDISETGDTARAVATDAAGNIYLTGSFSNGSNQDVKTIKYDTNGNLEWEIDFNGIANGEEYPLDITLDGDGDVIVTTQSEGAPKFGYATIKYVESDYKDLEWAGEDDPFPNAFITNLGQLRDSSGTAHPDVNYYSKHSSYMSYYKDDAFEWMTRTHHADTTMNDTLQKVAFSFVNPDNDLRVRPYHKSDYFENYYFPYGPKKLERVPFYETLLYEEIWEDVAMETSFGKGQELSFTVGKDGKADNIKLNLIGANSLVKNTNGTVSVHFFNGYVDLPRARAYQENGSGVLTELAWQPALKLTGNQLSFDSIGAFNQAKNLVLRLASQGDFIEADGLCHSTYFGGPFEERLYDAATDIDGSLIHTGRTADYTFYQGNNDLVVVGGASPVDFQGYVAKFNRDMVPDFMTVIHGQFDLIFQGVATRSNGDIYAAGPTSASDLFTVNDVGADFFDESLDGFRDSYMTLLNGSNGQIQWGTYFGGDNTSSPGGFEAGFTDVIFDIAVDSQDRLYAVGITYTESTGFPFENLPGAYFDNASDYLTGFIARFSPTQEIEWCTLFGGDGEDQIESISIGDNDQIVVAGLTESTDIDIQPVSGTTQDLSLAGVNDWFLTVFDQNGVYQWGTLIGSDGEEDTWEIMHSVDFDSDDAIYFAYQSNDYTGLTHVNPGGGAFFKNVDSGSGNDVNGRRYAMITKFDATTYNKSWSTQLLDGTGATWIHSLDVRDNFIFLGGATIDNTMTINNGGTLYSQSLTPGTSSGFGRDAFTMLFRRSGNQLLYSTYFGGSEFMVGSDNVRAALLNGFNEAYFTGFSNSKYFTNEDGQDRIGIALNNNDVDGAYFQSNLAGSDFVLAPDAYMTKLCFDEVPLSINDKIEDELHSSPLRIAPNPVQVEQQVRISLDNYLGIANLTVMDVSGRMVYQEIVNLTADGFVLDISGINPSTGVYLIGLQTGFENYTKKLLIID